LAGAAFVGGTFLDFATAFFGAGFTAAGGFAFAFNLLVAAD
jgi:hypothetical protein